MQEEQPREEMTRKDMRREEDEEMREEKRRGGTHALSEALLALRMVVLAGMGHVGRGHGAVEGEGREGGMRQGARGTRRRRVKGAGSKTKKTTRITPRTTRGGEGGDGKRADEERTSQTKRRATGRRQAVE